MCLRSFLQILWVSLVMMAIRMETFAGESDQRFVEDVLPLLRAKCQPCHGPEKQEGELRLDSLIAATTGGSRGGAVVPSDPASSIVIQAISFRDPDLQMPPKQKLSEGEIKLLTDWIQAGATWTESVDSPQPVSTRPIGDAFTDPENPIRKLFHGERLDLWSLRKPVKGVVPNGNANPVDAWIGVKLAAAKLSVSPQADRRTLIRRATLDLTGLPPTPAEVVAFESDESPDAFEQLVERLLASPHYGERQARYWLDVVRYADTQGYERDEFRPLTWQYRDYVARSFNQDKPFDQFIREQLAGDEQVDGPPGSPEEIDMLIATGYLRIGQWDSTASIFQEEDRVRAETLADLTNTTASAFLGLTMSCCQCHDHKYDPLSQADHYRLRAFFAGLEFEGEIPISHAQEQAEIDRHNAEIDPQIEQLRTKQGKLDKEKEEEKSSYGELQKQIDEFVSKRRSPRMALGAKEMAQVPPTHIFYQGDHLSPRDEVTPGFVSLIAPGDAPLTPPRVGVTGRRSSLADWIASPENPWTARVIVNRIWQQHFGIGLVATPNDFGYTGSRPTHPELLDWMAVMFMEQGWSIKHLHRQIMLTAAYRQASRELPLGLAIDPSNRLMWRQNVQRLDAETLRDSLLAVTGLLRPCATGEPRWPPMPEDLLRAQPGILEALEGDDGGRRQGWYANKVAESDVRSLFLIRKRCLPIPFLQVFDLPDMSISCARRETTVVAPQSLMLLNSPEGIRYARALATQSHLTGGPLDLTNTEQLQTLIQKLFQLALQRAATPDELRLSVDFLERHVEAHQSSGNNAGQMAVTDLCRAILNLNEFIYID